jgi:hypothetical protein
MSGFHWTIRRRATGLGVIIALISGGCVHFPGQEPVDARAYIHAPALDGVMDDARCAIAPIGLRKQGRFLEIDLLLQGSRDDIRDAACTLPWIFYYWPNEALEIRDAAGQELRFRDIAKEMHEKGARVNIIGGPSLVVPFEYPDQFRALLTSGLTPMRTLKPGVYTCRLDSAFIENCDLPGAAHLFVVGDRFEFELVNADLKFDPPVHDPWDASAER